MNDGARGFDLLRVSLEARLSGATMLAITSARTDDGTNVVAGGLAEAFAQAGRETLLVSTGPAALGALRTAASSGRGGSLVRSTADQLTANVPGGRAALVATLQSLRERYGIVLVDAQALPGSALAFELARASDGVLVSVRFGRRPCDEDRVTIKLLDDARANVLGIVPTNIRAAAAPVEETALGALRDDGLRRHPIPLEVTR